MRHEIIDAFNDRAVVRNLGKNVYLEIYHRNDNKVLGNASVTKEQARELAAALLEAAGGPVAVKYDAGTDMITVDGRSVSADVVRGLLSTTTSTAPVVQPGVTWLNGPEPLSLRDRIAIEALHACLTKCAEFAERSAEEHAERKRTFARAAYALADEMLKARGGGR